MSKINIFYADDDDDDLMFFHDAFDTISSQNEKVSKLHLHKNGDFLLDGIKQNKNDTNIVLLDINMPRKSGFDFLKEIRSEPEIETVPVIIYSTSSDVGDIKLSQHLGANYYAVKPYNFNDLKKMIATVVQINWQIQKPDFNNFLFNEVITSNDLI